MAEQCMEAGKYEAPEQCAGAGKHGADERCAEAGKRAASERSANSELCVTADQNNRRRISYDNEGVLVFSSKNYGIRKLCGAIFDLDGTLLDSLNVWRDVDLNFFKKVGKTPEKDIIKILQPLTLDKAAEYIYSNYNVCSSPDEIAAIMLEMIEPQYYSFIQLKSGARDFLDLLKRHNVKMSIATATNMRLTEAVLKRTGIISYFDAIISCSDIGTSKMFPEVYYQALKAINIPISETLVFEDAYLAMKTLYNAKFSSAAIYDDVTKKQWEQIKELADIHILSFDLLIDDLK